LRYDQPLGIESAPLVERLLDDLTKSNERQTELALLAEKRANEIAVAEQHVLPVRKENTRLVRENNELHMQIIADAEAAEAA
jgi:centrosomal protein CEP135